MPIPRSEILARLRQKIADRKPLFMGGAGIGLVAKILDRAGIDAIMAYNTGPFRMDGHGSLAGYLAYGDANGITLQLAGQICPVVRRTPVVGGIGAADPYRDVDRLIGTYLELGFSGITNVPTAGIYDGVFRRQIDHTGLGYPLEIELIRKCRARDIFTIAYAFTPDEVLAMADAGADVIGLHVGLTTGGSIGAGHALDIDAACRRIAELSAVARAARPDAIVVAHGGPFEDPDGVQLCFDRVDVDGFLAASSIERLPIEAALTKAAEGYLGLRLQPKSPTPDSAGLPLSADASVAAAKMPTVVLIGTLDTKGREYGYLKQCLEPRGVRVLVVDVGILGQPAIEPDMSAAEVAAAAGTTLDSLRFSREGSDTRAVALAAMERGAIAIVRRLHAEGRCDAVLGAGGSGGSTVISSVMRAMPLGMPKLLVSTMPMHTAAFVGTRDLTIMHAVTDIAGLNAFSRKILRNAAFAVAGMVGHASETATADKPLVAITMFGVTTPGVLRVQALLHAAGFETIVFHAVGSGGRAMEEMIADGLIDGVIDYTTSELTDELLGGIFGAGPHRLEAAGKRGIPQVVVPGAIEVLNFGARATVPARFAVPERRLVVHNPNVCAVRTTQLEAEQLARIMAGKLNAATGPTAVLLPLLGLDSYQQLPDGPFIDAPVEDAFFATLRGALRSGIPVREEPSNINDAAFAEATVETFLQLWSFRGGATRGGG